MNAIGPKLPLFRDDRFGNYALVTSYVEEVKQNFKILLLTAPGERMMNPSFGVGLRHFLFEPKDASISKIRQKIKEQITRYMPYIRINKLQFNHNIPPELEDDLNILSILIEYEVPSLNLSSQLIVQSEDIN